MLLFHISSTLSTDIISIQNYCSGFWFDIQFTNKPCFCYNIKWLHMISYASNMQADDSGWLVCYSIDWKQDSSQTFNCGAHMMGQIVVLALDFSSLGDVRVPVLSKHNLLIEYLCLNATETQLQCINNWIKSLVHQAIQIPFIFDRCRCREGAVATH